MTQRNALIINFKDNVAIALRDLPMGDLVSVGAEDSAITALENVPASHKVAIEDIAAGQPVLKYGELIGLAARDIKRGEWVHTHNLALDIPVGSYDEYIAGAINTDDQKRRA